MECMKTNLVDHAETKIVSAERGTKTKMRCPLLVLVLISAALGAGGCEGTYTAYPGYGPYYGGYGPGYGPGSPLCRLPGLRYSRGWRPGLLYSRPWLLRRPHLLRLEAWTLEMRNGQRVWIHGHYVLR